MPDPVLPRLQDAFRTFYLSTGQRVAEVRLDAAVYDSLFDEICQQFHGLLIPLEKAHCHRWFEFDGVVYRRMDALSRPHTAMWE